MQPSTVPLFLLFLTSTLLPTTLAAPGRNLTEVDPTTNLLYPKGYSSSTCPAKGNGWGGSSSSSQSTPKYRIRSFGSSSSSSSSTPGKANANANANNDENKAVSIPLAPTKLQARDSSSLCSSIASQSFNYNGAGFGYRTGDILLQAGIQYIISFSSNTPVLGVTVYQEVVGTALSHVVSHPNFARSVSGTISFTLQQAANVWMVVKFASGLPAQGQLGVFALGTPSAMNVEAGSGGL